MRCEVCGLKIYGTPQKVIIEGAKLTVCHKCAKHGTTHWEETVPRTLKPKPKVVRQPLKIQTKRPQEMTLDTSLELIESFDKKIKKARERLGLSYEELGKKINEKVSVLKKIENRKMTPDTKLSTKLEHALKIKLLVPASEEKIPQTKIPKPVSRVVTLGDLIQMKKEESAKRKP